MTTTGPHHEGELVIDTTHTAAVPFSRLVRVELRKMVNTRSGFWLLSITFALLMLTAALVLLVTALTDQTIASMPLAEGTNLMREPVDIGGTEWAQFSVATLIWVVLPLVLGAMRVRSSEVK